MQWLLNNFSQKTQPKDFRASPRSHDHWRNAVGYYETRTRGNCPIDESRSTLSQRPSTIEINCSTYKEYLSQTPYLRQSVKALNCFSKQSSWRHEAQFTYNWIKIHWKSRQILKDPILWLFSAKRHKKSSLGVETCIKFHFCTFCFELFLNSSDIHHFGASWNC